MTEQEIALTRSVLAHAYWNKLTPEEATALNNLYYACELLRERARTAMEDGRAEGRQEERAAAATWLRSDAFIQHWQQALGRLMCDVAADGIERGDHRREKP